VPIPADSKALVTAVKSGSVTCEEFEECFTKTLEAPLDLPSETPVQIKTDEGASVSVEEEGLMKEQIAQLEKRISELEALIKGSTEQAAEAKKMIESVQVLFGSVMTQMATKKAPDVNALTGNLPDGKGSDVIKQAFSMLEAMQGKLNASR
jgi:hypothetical protein